VLDYKMAWLNFYINDVIMQCPMLLLGASLEQLVQLLATDWTTKGLGFKS
jgi:hypothetical protein